MFLLGILVAVVAMAVIRTQQVLLTSPTKIRSVSTTKQKFATKKTLANAFFFQCFPRNNAEEQQLGEETQDTEEPLNRTMADF